MKRAIRIGVTAALALGAWGAPASAEIPSFMHFQGVLTDDEGLPVNDTLPIFFTFYEDTTLAAVWSFVEPAAPVINGYYDVYIDVSPLPFDEPIFMGIQVNGQPLGPKKPLASVPYSMRSAKTKVVPGAGLAGTSDSSVVTLSIQNQGITNAMLGDNVVSGSKIATEAITGLHMDEGAVGTSILVDSLVVGSKIARMTVVRSLSGLTDDVSLLAGSNVTITPGAGTLTISATASGAVADDDWVVDGNNAYSQPSGNVGVGTAAPAYKLDVVGDVYASGRLRSGAPNGTPPLSIASTTAVGNLNADLVDGYHAADFSLAAHAHDGSAITTGTVPFARLPVGNLANTVASGVHNHDAGAITTGTVDFARLPAGTGASQVSIGNHTHAGGDGDWTIAGNNIYSTVIGNVGIGTSSPGRKLDVNGNMGVDGALFARDATGIGFADQTGFLGVWVEDGGDVGVGFTTPATTMHVYEGAGAAELRVESPVAGSHAAITLKSNGTTWNRMEIEQNSPTSPNSTAGISLANVSRIAAGADAGPLMLQVMEDTCMYFITNQRERVRITSTGETRFSGAIEVGDSSDTDDDVIYFNDTEKVMWDESDLRFELTDGLSVGGPFSAGYFAVPSYTDQQYNFFTYATSPTPASGDMSTGGDLYCDFDIEAGSDIYYSGNLTDLSVVPPFMEGRTPEEVSTEEARSVLASLRPRVIPVVEREEGKSFSETTKLGFLPSELPDLVKNGQGNGYRPLDLVAILAKVVQEQQRTIEEQSELIEEIGTRLRALEQTR